MSRPPSKQTSAPSIEAVLDPNVKADSGAAGASPREHPSPSCGAACWKLQPSPAAGAGALAAADTSASWTARPEHNPRAALRGARS